MNYYEMKKVFYLFIYLFLLGVGYIFWGIGLFDFSIWMIWFIFGFFFEFGFMYFSVVKSVCFSVFVEGCVFMVGFIIFFDCLLVIIIFS